MLMYGSLVSNLQKMLSIDYKDVYGLVVQIIKFYEESL